MTQPIQYINSDDPYHINIEWISVRNIKIDIKQHTIYFDVYDEKTHHAKIHIMTYDESISFSIHDVNPIILTIGNKFGAVMNKFTIRSNVLYDKDNNILIDFNTDRKYDGDLLVFEEHPIDSYDAEGSF